ncbi:MAG TPA: Sec-dependent nitrous-oxide reductase, partial [Gemmatimonadaceae bacterium]|nr:Sec-dependent nitrous-oxide reductase [Gemmatimonadaceae bacterium]
MIPSRKYALVGFSALVVAAAAYTVACAPTTRSAGAGTADAAARVYVPPGSYDEYYAFLSGGFSGQLGVYGIPSGRLLKVIPVFSQNPENGYGYNQETRDMLQTTWGFVPWDDLHHPALSVTNSEHDGRWLFVNANNTPRIARIDLAKMTTVEIVQIPNSAGNHSSPYVTANTEYAVAGTRFSVPIPQADIPISDYEKGTFKGAISFIRADQPGKMRVAWQFVVPGYNYDLARAGKGPSADWVFFTSYNTEQAYTKLEVEASKNDKDFVMALNWKKLEQCVAQGRAEDWPSEYYHNYMDEATHTAKSERVTGVKVLTPKDCPDAAYYLPTPKSPHGVDVDPTGEYIVAGGKLATVIPVHSFSKMTKAIAEKAFDGERDGIPVIKYEAVNFCEVQNPGLGPLHTEFDGQGNAYTSVFISSEIVKFTLPGCEVVDRVPTYYSIGHLMIPGGDTRKPYGKYVIALNKITKDRYLPTGAELTQSAQLYDITGDKMKILLDFPTVGEPHYAQAIDANLIKDKQVKFYKLSENRHPWVARSEQEVNVSRSGKVVHVKMTAIRSHFAPDNIEGVQVGDTVYFHVTNLEQDWDIPHGFAAIGTTQDAELLIMPGETRTLKWVAKFPG